MRSCSRGYVCSPCLYHHHYRNYTYTTRIFSPFFLYFDRAVRYRPHATVQAHVP